MRTAEVRVTRSSNWGFWHIIPISYGGVPVEIDLDSAVLGEYPVHGAVIVFKTVNTIIQRDTVVCYATSVEEALAYVDTVRVDKGQAFSNNEVKEAWNNLTVNTVTYNDEIVYPTPEKIENDKLKEEVGVLKKIIESYEGITVFEVHDVTSCPFSKEGEDCPITDDYCLPSRCPLRKGDILIKCLKRSIGDE